MFLDADDLADRFGASSIAGDYEPRYNVDPGGPLDVISNEAPEEIDRMHWGLVPDWDDEPGDGLINARSETAHEKRSFADAWAARPCLVLSTGFYEWRPEANGPKTPFRIYRDREGPETAMALAGLWDVWESGEADLTCVTILTTDPNELVEPIHERMPVVLPREEERTWLEAGPEERRELCRPYPGDDLDAYEISRAVNDPTNDDPSIIEPIGHDQSDLGSFG